MDWGIGGLEDWRIRGLGDWRIGGLERHQLRIRCGRNLMVDVSQREGKNGSSGAEMFPCRGWARSYSISSTRS